MKLTKQNLIRLLVSRRQELGGSVSENNLRRLLETRTREELQEQWNRICENESAAEPPHEFDRLRRGGYAKIVGGWAHITDAGRALLRADEPKGEA